MTGGFKMSNKIDEHDKQILKYLQEDGSISNLELSKRIGLAPSSCLLRTKSLKERGIISRTTILVDEKKLGYDVVAYATVYLSPLTREASNNFIKEINQIDEVIECYTITGQGSFLLKIVARDLQYYRDFVIDKLLAIDHVVNVESNMVVGAEKVSSAIPLE
jgi:Lrp/AsnC family transcriptional regulator